MLFKTTVTEWKGIGRASRVIVKALGTEFVLNINCVSHLLPFGTGSEFFYRPNTTDRKVGYEKIYCTTPYLTVKQEYDVVPVSIGVELSIYPDNDLNKTPFNMWINLNDFGYAWAHNPYPQYSWLVYYMAGGKEKRILIDKTLDELLDVDNPFTALNTQWFVFVDPLEEIHPTWFIRVA